MLCNSYLFESAINETRVLLNIGSGRIITNNKYFEGLPLPAALPTFEQSKILVQYSTSTLQYDPRTVRDAAK